MQSASIFDLYPNLVFEPNEITIQDFDFEMDQSDPSLLQQQAQSPQAAQGIHHGALPGPALPAVQVPGDLGELARLVATATAAAAQAAEAAASTAGGKGANDKNKKEWYRLIPRPAVFAPSDREQEVSLWRDWFWSFKQYLMVVDGKYEEDIAEVDKSPDTEVDWDLLSEEEQHRGRFLYSLLGSLVQGRLLSMIRCVEHSNGLEALRMLMANCQPKSRNRTMSMLQGLMGYPNFNMKMSVMAQVQRLEEHFGHYEKLGGKLTDEMKSAILLKCISGPLKVHLNLSLNEGSKYEVIRDTIKAYDTATTRWNESSLTQQPFQPDPNGPAPMEIDRVRDEKGQKGKGKHKGKDSKGKGKGKDQKGKGKQNTKGNPWNSSTTSSTSSWSLVPSKGGQKGQKGKEEKGKSKGKGGKEPPACYTCGQQGHLARDCWKVRQVGGAQEAATVLTSATAYQESVGPSASAMTVKRVSLAEDGTSRRECAVFDMRGSSPPSSGSVKVVQFYYIDDDVEIGENDKIRSTQFLETEVMDHAVDSEEVRIVIDSGADAPIFPSSMIHCGEHHPGESPQLQDAQGNPIPTMGQRSVSICLDDINGAEVELIDNVVFSSQVTQPILSYGRLMSAGWSIDAETRCLRNGNYSIPVELQNNSVVVRGSVRSITTSTAGASSPMSRPLVVRSLKAELTDGLKGYVEQAFGWHKDGSRWVGVHLSDRYQDPIYIGGIDHSVEWLRTTLIKKDQTWLMLEYCEQVTEMVDANRYIEETLGRTKALRYLPF